jgi:hypothetical protein
LFHESEAGLKRVAPPFERAYFHYSLRVISPVASLDAKKMAHAAKTGVEGKEIHL